MFLAPHHRRVSAPSGIIRDGLIMRHDFNEGAGTIANDDSGGGHHSNLTNVDAGTWVAGVEGTAIKLNGSNQFAENQTLILNGRTAISVCMWVKYPSVKSGYLFSAPNATSQLGTAMWAGTTGTQMNFGLRVGGEQYNVTTPNIYVDDEFHSMIGTWDGSEIFFTIDDVEYGPNIVSGSLETAANQNVIGRLSILSGGANSNAAIDDFRIYDRALSQAERTQYYLQTG